jgi:hypothetical protein
LPQTPTTVRVTAAEAKRAGLPAIGFTIDPGGHALGAATLRFPDSYVTLSGPPGGTKMIDVRAYKGAANDATALASLRGRFDKPGFGPATYGAPERVDVAGAMRPAQAAIVGKGFGHSQWCVALVADPGGSDAGLAVFVGVSAGPSNKPSCAAVLETSLGAVVRTLRLTKP